MTTGATSDGGDRAARPAGRRPSPRAWFRRGLRQRSPLVLAVAALAALGLVWGAQHWVTRGGLRAVPEERLLRISHDDYLHVAYRVAELRARPPRRPTVYLFGGSGTMECFISEASLARAISAAAGRQVDVVSLAAHQQSMAMTLAIADNLPPGPAVLAVGLAPIRVTWSPEQDRGLVAGRPLLLHSPRLAALAPALYGRRRPLTGIAAGLLDFTGAYLSERAEGLSWGRPLDYDEHYYGHGSKGALPFAKRRNVLWVVEEDARLYRRNADYNFRLLEELLRLARERGWGVVLFDQPLNGFAAGPDWAGVVPAYQRRAQALARRYGVPYLRLGRHVPLRDGDFADLYHLLGRGRQKWQPEMARRIGLALRRWWPATVAQPAGRGTGGSPPAGARPGGRPAARP